jgi:hypothetical protein
MQQKKTYIICSPSYLEHSAKGSTWRNHKYIKKENGRYYYPKDESSNASKRAKNKRTNPEDTEEWQEKYPNLVKEIKDNGYKYQSKITTDSGKTAYLYNLGEKDSDGYGLIIPDEGRWQVGSDATSELGKYSINEFLKKY